MQPRRTPTKTEIRWSEGKPCALCGTPILSRQLSREDFKRRYEMKWCVHYACHMKVQGVMDREQ